MAVKKITKEKHDVYRWLNRILQGDKPRNAVLSRDEIQRRQRLMVAKQMSDYEKEMML